MDTDLDSLERRNAEFSVKRTLTIKQVNPPLVPQASEAFMRLEPITFNAAKKKLSFSANTQRVRHLNNGMYEVDIEFMSNGEMCAINRANIYRDDNGLCVMVPVDAIIDDGRTTTKNYRVILRKI